MVSELAFVAQPVFQAFKGVETAAEDAVFFKEATMILRMEVFGDEGHQDDQLQSPGAEQGGEYTRNRCKAFQQ